MAAVVNTRQPFYMLLLMLISKVYLILNYDKNLNMSVTNTRTNNIASIPTIMAKRGFFSPDAFDF